MANDEKILEEQAETETHQDASGAEDDEQDEGLMAKARKWGQQLRQRFRPAQNGQQALETIAEGPDEEMVEQENNFPQEQAQYLQESLAPAIAPEEYKEKLVAVLTSELCTKYGIDKENPSEADLETLNQALNESVSGYAKDNLDLGLPDPKEFKNGYDDDKYWDRMRSTAAYWRCLLTTNPDASRDYSTEYKHLLDSPSPLEKEYISTGELPTLPEAQSDEIPTSDKYILIARRVTNTDGEEAIQVLSRSQFPMVSIAYKSNEMYDTDKVVVDIQKTLNEMVRIDPRFEGFQPITLRITLSQMDQLANHSALTDLDHWTLKPAEKYRINKREISETTPRS